MLKKTLVISTLAAGIGLAALPAAAGHRDDDRAAGAIVGGTIGALVGSSVHGSEGALVGGVLGALTGAAAADSRGHVHFGYTYGPPRYYDRAYHAPPRYYPDYRPARYYSDYRPARYYSDYRPARSYRRDWDGDGVPNRWDSAPHNPRWR